MNIYRFDQFLAHGLEGNLFWFEWDKNDFPNEADLSIPALPPPKRFLRAGSQMWVSDNILYRWTEDAQRMDFASTVTVNKFQDLRDEDKLRLLKITYFFVRDKNSMAEKKGGFRSLIYNTKTKGLYLTTPLPEFKETKKGKLAKKRTWQKRIIRISLNFHQLANSLGSFDSKFVDKFVEALHEVVSNDVPDVVLETGQKKAHTIISLIIQHRIGRGLKGLTPICINNLQSMAMFDFVDSRLSLTDPLPMATSNETWQKRIKRIAAEKRKTVYQFIPTLKKTHSMKKALAVMLDESYCPLFPRIISDVDFESVSVGSAHAIATFKRDAPKSIQHFLPKAVNEWEPGEFNNLFGSVLDMCRTTAGDNVKDAWVRTVRRFNKNIPWRAWNDIYRMAGQLRVRVRPNNFKNLNEVWDFHDQLSAITRRQQRLTGGFFDVPGHFHFVKLSYPEIFENFKFEQITGPGRLEAESDYMGHCVHGYKSSCMRGDSIIFSVEGPAPECLRYTVEYAPDDRFRFIQAEGAKKDNDGLRNICGRELIDSIFIPFSMELRKANDTKLSYTSLSTLNKAILSMKDHLFAVEGALEHYENSNMQQLEQGLCKSNQVLEDLITLDWYVQNGHVRNSIELIDSVENILEGHTKHPDTTVRPQHITPAPAQLNANDFVVANDFIVAEDDHPEEEAEHPW